MCRFQSHLTVALLTFAFGVLGVSLWIIKSAAPQLTLVEIKEIREIEPEIQGFDEVISAKDGMYVTVQGLIDGKFLCLDVTDSQRNVCTTSLIGNSAEHKHMHIRFSVCNEQNKSSCIEWQPDNLCSNGIRCSEDIRIYDNHSNLINSIYPIKATGKISVVAGKGRFANSIESIEQNEEFSEKIKEIKKIKGKLVKFEIGDYTHATIRKSTGKTESFFICEPGLDYFLALHKGKQIELTYKVSDTFIPEASANTRIECLTSAKSGSQTYENWWKETSAKYSAEELEEKYGSLVEYSVR